MLFVFETDIILAEHIGMDTMVENDHLFCVCLPDLISELWELVMNYKTKRGRRLAVAFMNVPTKKEDPNYAANVEQPMDLTTIKKRKSDDAYTFTEIVEDLNVMCFNTREYYDEKDEIWQDVCCYLMGSKCIAWRQIDQGCNPFS